MGLSRIFANGVELAARHLVTQCGVFDAEFYCKEYPDVMAAGVDALAHYRQHGWREGRRPGPIFDAAFVADGPMRRFFPNHDPMLVWSILGRWIGWDITAPAVRSFLQAAKPGPPSDLMVVVHEASRTGAPLFALRLVRWLREHRGVSPLVVLLGGGPLLPEFFRFSACIPLFAVAHAERHGLMARCSLRHGTVYYNSLAALRASDWAPSEERSVVIHCHEGLTTAAEYAALLKAAARARPRVISVSPETGSFLTRTLGSPPAIIPPAIDIAAGRRVAATVVDAKVSRRPIIIGCGVRSLRKGADMFCDIAARIIEEHGSAVRFRWVGRPGDFDMKQRLHQLGIGADVDLIGEVDDALPHLAQASALLIPSREDPFPLVALEAASCGVPVFCFDSLANGIGTWIGTTAGATVQAFDVDLMARTLADAVRDPQRLAKLGDGARLAVQAFDIASIGPRIANVIWPQ